MSYLKYLTFGTLLAAICAIANATEKHPLGLVELPVAEPAPNTLRVTWYGVAMLLFDDGETKVLVDAFISRPSRPTFIGEGAARTMELIEPDVAQITRMIEEADLDGLAAITPVHSHFDHAMDLGVVAKLTGATVFGSVSTANIARGAGVPEDRIKVIDERGEFTFGKFQIQLIKSQHAPITNGGPPFPGTIDAPLVPPAKLNDWKEGGSYSIIISHPAGSAIVQGSAGYVEGNLPDIQADVAFLGIGGLKRLGKSHTDQYFAEIVAAVGATCILPIHWDDFYQPFGTIVYNGDDKMLGWLRDFAAQGKRTVAALPFGKAVNPFQAGCGIQ